MDLATKQIAIVTGGSRGIGAAISKALARDGFHVCVGYTSNDAKAQEVLAEIETAGGSASLHKFDVGKEPEITAAIQAIGKHWGRIDCLVNNAGVSVDGLFLRLKGDDLNRTLDINLKGAIFCARDAARYLLKSKNPSILNISSVVGEMGNAGQVSYAASKAGLIGFSKSLARELASRQIRVNAVTPGYIDTDMTQALTEEQRAAIANKIPLGKLGSASDIAELVSFLASDKATYITGQVLGVNGGLYI